LDQLFCSKIFLTINNRLGPPCRWPYPLLDGRERPTDRAYNSGDGKNLKVIIQVLPQNGHISETEHNEYGAVRKINKSRETKAARILKTKPVC
jgi:hypothetical protein